MLADTGVILPGKSEGLHDDPAISLNMFLTDPSSIRWEQRVKAGKATIDGVSIADKARATELAKKIVDFRTEKAVAAIRAAIAGKAEAAPKE
jgi:creatinine amidohydrolase